MPKKNTGYEFWNKIYNDKNNFNIIENTKKYISKVWLMPLKLAKKGYTKNSKNLNNIARYLIFSANYYKVRDKY